jgi:hypothetical protein
MSDFIKGLRVNFPESRVPVCAVGARRCAGIRRKIPIETNIDAPIANPD